MARKEYLKMADVFHGGERQSDTAGIGGVIDSNGEFILQAIENNYCRDMMQGYRNEYRDNVAKYAAHAINSHDELVAEVERLRGALTSSRLALSNAAMNMKWFDISKAQEILREVNAIDKLISAIGTSDAKI